MARSFGWLLVIAAICGGASGAAFGAGRAYEVRVATPVAATSGAASTPRAGAGGAQATGSGQAASASGAPAAGAGTNASGGAFGAGGRATVGTVTKVDGQTLTLTTADNQVVTVTIPAEVTITRQAPVALADVAVGSRVSVVSGGAQGAPPVVQSVAVLPDVAGGVAGGRGPGGPGGAQGAGQGRGQAGAPGNQAPAAPPSG